MKRIDVSEQPSLGLARTFSLTIIGIRYRMFRSLVTVVVVVVAITFLMNILSESLIKSALVGATEDRIAEMRQAATWIARLSNPGTIEEIILGIASAGVEDPIHRESQKMGDLSDEEMSAFRLQCLRAADYLNFFADLDYGCRRRLVHNALGSEVFDRLSQPGEVERLESELGAMKSIRFVSSFEVFREFLDKWPALKRQATRVQQGHAAAIGLIAKRLEGRSRLEALADANGEFGEVIREAGISLDQRTAEVVALQATQISQMRFLEGTALKPEVRKTVAGYLDIAPLEVNVQVLWKLLRNRQMASWYLSKLKEQGMNVRDITAERAVALADLQAENTALTRVAHLGGDVGGGLMGIGERMSWLVFVSMLVCVVGITNAMLMSVTERFREIATLKCLGALDTSIMLICVIEASLLGVVGGVVGSVIGVIIGFARLRVAFGGLASTAIPFGQLLAAMVVSVVVGIILAAIAALYPSFKAARLAPMEAMRVE